MRNATFNLDIDFVAHTSMQADQPQPMDKVVKEEGSQATLFSCLDLIRNDDATASSHAVGKKIGLSRHYTRLLIDEGEEAPVARSRDKVIVKARSIGNGYETLLVSTKSIILALQTSEFGLRIRGRKVLVFPYPEWQGQPRTLVDIGGGDLALEGDYVILQSVDSGIFLKLVGKLTRHVSKMALDAVPLQDEVRAGPGPLDARRNQLEAQAAEIKNNQIRNLSLAPGRRGGFQYAQLMAELPNGLPKKGADEDIQDHFVRVAIVVGLQPSIREIFTDFLDWVGRSSRFKVLLAARVFKAVCSRRAGGTRLHTFARRLQVTDPCFYLFTTSYEMWRSAVAKQDMENADILSDVWLNGECRSVLSLRRLLKP